MLLRSGAMVILVPVMVVRLMIGALAHPALPVADHHEIT